MKKKADGVFREGRRLPRERRWIPYFPRELARGIVNVFRPRRIEPRGPVPLDAFGAPVEWRHDEIDQASLEHSREHWERFESWCGSSGRKAFPADADTCFDYLRAMWDRGPELYLTWQAIHERHDAYYWHTGADAVFRMSIYLGLNVLPDGTIVIRPVDPAA